MIYKYHDGSGNTYIIKDDVKKTIEFIPVKPLFSSSGVYNGGNYAKKEINKLQYAKITSIINKTIRNKESHIKNRVKMSGMIIIQEKDEKKTYILSPNSKELNEIEKILHNIIKN